MTYNSEYYSKNKFKLLEKNRAWRKANKEKIREQKRIYEARPDRKIKKREKSAKDYKDNREKYLIRQTNRRRERKVFMDEICVYYGCQNPECKWEGNFKACQLDFHHFDPSSKTIEVAKMESWSYEKIILEINKCIVLCRNCHAEVHHGNLQLNEKMLCNSETYLQFLKA